MMMQKSLIGGINSCLNLRAFFFNNSLDKKENKMRENFYIALIKNTVKEIKHKIQTLFHHLSAYISAIHLDSRCIKYTMYIC